MPRALDDLRRRLAAGAEVRVVCVGHTTWDETWRVDALPKGGGKMRARHHHCGGGGMAASAAVAVARLGGKSSYWGRAGNDPAGRAMRDELAGHGVELSGLRLFDGASSSVSAIVVDAQGERCIINFRGAELPDEPDALPLEQVSTASAVLVDPRWPAGALAAVRTARAAGVPTVLDGDVADAEVFDALLPWVDCAVFSEPGLAGYRPQYPDVEVRLRQVLGRGVGVAAVTMGERGVFWTDGGPLRFVPAFEVNVLDTTGAGDAFHGAFSLALGAGIDIAESFRFSSAVAALKCTQPGGRVGIPDLNTVLGWLATQAEPDAHT